MDDEAKFHWSEGMKYVSEGVKAMFLLNGAATLSVLTFIGNNKVSSTQLLEAMGSFAVGAATSPLTFLFAYLSQLKNGNAGSRKQTALDARKFHYAAYVFFALGLLLFLAGTGFAIAGLMSAKIIQP